MMVRSDVEKVLVLGGTFHKVEDHTHPLNQNGIPTFFARSVDYSVYYKVAPIGTRNLMENVSGTR